MMLLNNDYYLDMKTTLMSQELSAVIGNTGYLNDLIQSHINNTAIHGAKGTTIINNNYTSIISGDTITPDIDLNLNMLECDTVIYLSIGDSVKSINERINNVPHNLNGFNLAFMFVIPEDYDTSLSETNNYTEYSLNVKNQTIHFSNFFNGTLFVFGDFLQDTYVNTSDGKKILNFTKFTNKTKNQILDPVRFDKINVTTFIEKLYREIDNPVPIDEIINYESKNILAQNKPHNKIKIKGTSINSSYSLISFSDISAKTYVKNLTFESTLSAEDNIINLSGQLELDVPTSNKILLEYPFKSDGVPSIGYSFRDRLEVISTQQFISKMDTYINTIDKSMTSLYDIMMKDNLIIDGSAFIDYEVNDDFVVILREQLEDLKELPGVTDEWIGHEIDLSGQTYTIISSSILTELKNFNLEDVDYDEDLITKSDLDDLIVAFEKTYQRLDDIRSAVPDTNFETYIDGNGEFRADDFELLTNEYIKKVASFTESLSSVFANPTFSMFLSYRPDLVSDDIRDYTNDEAYAEFLDNSKVPVFLDSINYALSSILINVISPINMLTFDNLSSELAFSRYGTSVGFTHIQGLENSSDEAVHTDYEDGSIDTLKMEYDNLTNTYGYLGLTTNYNNVLAKLLFESNKWEDVSQKFTTTQTSASPMFDSQYDSTICFWTKYKPTTDIDKISFLSIKNGSDDFIFSIKPTTISTVSKTDEGNDDGYGGIDSTDIRTDNTATNAKNRNAWTMWSIKIDNTSRYINRSESEQDKNYKNLIGFNVSSYTFEEDLDTNSYRVIEHNINQYPINENNVAPSDLANYKVNYIYEPFKANPDIDTTLNITSEEYENQFKGLSINLGYSKEPTVNGNNEYFYDGYFRNLTLFKGHLSQREEEALFKIGILNKYEWPSEYERNGLEKLILGGNFFFGLVSVYDSNNVNIINCTSRYNGNTYMIK